MKKKDNRCFEIYSVAQTVRVDCQGDRKINFLWQKVVQISRKLITIVNSISETSECKRKATSGQI